jgi:hypothetical protein
LACPGGVASRWSEPAIEMLEEQRGEAKRREPSRAEGGERLRATICR